MHIWLQYSLLRGGNNEKIVVGKLDFNVSLAVVGRCLDLFRSGDQFSRSS